MLDASAILGQLADEFTARVRAGETPAVEDYAVRHPDLAGRIRELFPTLLMLEGLAAGGGERATGGDHVGRSFGPYRVVREIGRGGMGVVYEAVHEPLHKRVALKLLTVTGQGATGQLERFFREAQTAAGLHHTNIVPVFDIGQVGGTPYYAMQYIEGRGLDHVLRDESSTASEGAVTVDLPAEAPTLPPGADPLLALRAPRESVSRSGTMSHFRWVADVGIQAADGLAYAHDRGVIHRDIKPSNLIQDDRGVVWIADFGLARRADDPGLTKSGALVGTPRYMSPEQAEAAKKPIDHRTDVYSLGATLYELLTRRPAFDGPTPLDVVMQILERTPVSPRKLDPAVPRDLETIVLKAMAKRPDDRYPSTGALGADLKAWRDDRPIAARRIGPIGRFVRWSRRNPLVAGLTAAMFALLVMTAIGSVIAALAIRDQRNQAQSYLDTMLVGTSLLHLEQAKASLASTADGRRWNALNHLRLADHYAKPYRASRPDEVPSLEALRTSAVLALLTEDAHIVRSWNFGALTFGPPAISEGGRFALLLQSPVEKSDRAATIELVDLTTQKVIFEQQVPKVMVDELAKNTGNLVSKSGSATNKVALSPDGKNFVWAAYKGRILVWRLGEALPTCELSWPSPEAGKLHLRQLAVSPSGTRVVALASNEKNIAEIAMWKLSGGSGQLLAHIEPDCLGSFSFSSDGRLLVTPAKSNAIKLWDLSRDLAAREIDFAEELSSSILTCKLALSSDGNHLAIGQLQKDGKSDQIQVWNLETNLLETHFELDREHFVRSMAFEPRGHRLAVSEGSIEAIDLFDIRTSEKLTEFGVGAIMPNDQLVWRDDAASLASASLGKVEVWNVSKVPAVEKMPILDFSPNYEFSLDGRLAAILPKDESKPLEIMELSTGRILTKLVVPKSTDGALGNWVFAPDNRRISFFRGRQMFSWNLGAEAPGQPTESDLGRSIDDPVEAANGHILGLVHEGDEFIVWDATDRKPILSVPHVRTGLGEIQEVFLSGGGEWLTIVPEDDAKPITIWDLATQSKRAEWPQRLRSRQALVKTSLVSPSGRWLAQTTIDSEVKSQRGAAASVLDLRSGNRRDLPALPRDAFALAFSPDESLLAVALDDGFVEVFHVHTGERLFRWPTGGRLNLPALWFNPNGTELIASVRDWNSLRILKLDVLRWQLAEMGLDW